MEIPVKYPLDEFHKYGEAYKYFNIKRRIIYLKMVVIGSVDLRVLVHSLNICIYLYKAVCDAVCLCVTFFSIRYLTQYLSSGS